MKYLGAHVPASGGLQNAVINAQNIGANAFALFTKNQRQWIAKDLTDVEADLFKNLCAEKGFDLTKILPHDSYLINLGSADEDLLRKSREAFTDELLRCEKLGLTMLNFHPGSAKNWARVEDCLDKIAESVQMAIDRATSCIAVIENTAGQGNYVGYSFDQLKYLIDKIDRGERVGVCIDTCHAFAAGYNLGDEYEFKRIWEEFDSIIGRENLKAMHLNDSMKGVGSKVDRHESLGKGAIGINCFKWIMQDDRFDDIPLILETPKPELWADEIKILRKFAREVSV